MTRPNLPVRFARAIAGSGLLLLAFSTARADPDTYTITASAVTDAQSHENPEHPDACWRDNFVGLSQHSIGLALHNKGLRVLDTMIPMHPIGYPAEAYNHYPGLTYGFGNGLEASLTVTTASFHGTSAEPVFYALGIQKQVYGPACPDRGRWAVSVGGYGYTGNGWTGGAGFVAATGLVSGVPDRSGAIYAHGGVEVETFSNSENKTGVRPYVGFSWVAVRHRLTVHGEIATKQSWERQPPFALKVAFPIYKGYGIAVGIKSDGFDTVLSGPF